jgi:hypothetical protein
LLLLAWLPITWLAGEVPGGRPAAFAAVWLACAASQIPRGTWPGDWLARFALLAYLTAFLLPAVVPTPETTKFSDRTLLGYEVFSLAIATMADNIARLGSTVTLVATVGAWLANPLFVLGLALFRTREATGALVLGSLGALLAAGMLTVINPGPGHLLWLASMALLAIAAARGRSEW